MTKFPIRWASSDIFWLGKKYKVLVSTLNSADPFLARLKKEQEWREVHIHSNTPVYAGRGWSYTSITDDSLYSGTVATPPSPNALSEESLAVALTFFQGMKGKP